MPNKIRVIHMVSSSHSVNLMRGQLSYLQAKGYEITLISPRGNKLDEAGKRENVKTKSIEMQREISPFRDVIALVKIITYFFRVRPKIVNAGTPKAGFLGMIASWITRVPIRIYTNRGLPLEGTRGVKYRLLLLTEKISCRLATKVICISPSIKNKLIQLKLVDTKKAIVINQGSSNGIHPIKYELTPKVQDKIDELKRDFALAKKTMIIGYVGRIVSFKGIHELMEAFDYLKARYKDIVLIMVGRFEDKDSIGEPLKNRILNDSNILYFGEVENPAPYYRVMDVLVFPTYREGFGNVSIEAQANGTPVITTNATGSIDTVINGKTGYLIPIKDSQAIVEKVESLLNDRCKLEIFKENAVLWATKNFNSVDIWEGIDYIYKKSLQKNNNV